MRMVLIEVLAPKLVPFHYWISTMWKVRKGQEVMFMCIREVFPVPSVCFSQKPT